MTKNTETMMQIHNFTWTLLKQTRPNLEEYQLKILTEDLVSRASTSGTDQESSFTSSTKIADEMEPFIFGKKPPKNNLKRTHSGIPVLVRIKQSTPKKEPATSGESVQKRFEKSLRNSFIRPKIVASKTKSKSTSEVGVPDRRGSNCFACSSKENISDMTNVVTKRKSLLNPSTRSVFKQKSEAFPKAPKNSPNSSFGAVSKTRLPPNPLTAASPKLRLSEITSTGAIPKTKLPLKSPTGANPKPKFPPIPSSGAIPKTRTAPNQAKEEPQGAPAIKKRRMSSNEIIRWRSSVQSPKAMPDVFERLYSGPKSRRSCPNKKEVVPETELPVIPECNISCSTDSMFSEAQSSADVLIEDLTNIEKALKELAIKMEK